MELMDAQRKAVTNAWLDHALQTHRFLPPNLKPVCDWRDLCIKTRNYVMRAVHPDKIPLTWKQSPEHNAAVHTTYNLLGERFLFHLQRCAGKMRYTT